MSYVHGYSDRETRRLEEQSLILEELLHNGTMYPPGSRVLEVGCGVGAQTIILLRRNPGIHLVSMDVSVESINRASKSIEEAGFSNVDFRHADIFHPPFQTGAFDHLFVCFVLEHLDDPDGALEIMKNLLKPGGSLTVIEGDHGSGFWTPESEASRAAWNGLITAQRKQGHDPNIGRRLFPLLEKAGFQVEDVSPRAVYADRSDPVLLAGVVNQIIAPMVFSAERQVIDEGLVEVELWQQGLKDISGVASCQKGTFFYTWFKGLATNK